jgi:hypothetical protein
MVVEKRGETVLTSMAGLWRVVEYTLLGTPLSLLLARLGMLIGLVALPSTSVDLQVALQCFAGILVLGVALTILTCRR